MCRCGGGHPRRFVFPVLTSEAWRLIHTPLAPRKTARQVREDRVTVSEIVVIYREVAAVRGTEE
jgi:hypothetical protein